MIDPATALTIVLMAVATYLTRILGYFALRKRNLSVRALSMMEAAPGCVLISVIAPGFVSERPADLLALVITVMAAARLPILPTVLVGIGAAAFLRHVLM